MAQAKKKGAVPALEIRQTQHCGPFDPSPLKIKNGVPGWDTRRYFSHVSPRHCSKKKKSAMVQDSGYARFSAVLCHTIQKIRHDHVLLPPCVCMKKALVFSSVDPMRIFMARKERKHSEIENNRIRQARVKDERVSQWYVLPACIARLDPHLCPRISI